MKKIVEWSLFLVLTLSVTLALTALSHRIGFQRGYEAGQSARAQELRMLLLRDPPCAPDCGPRPRRIRLVGMDLDAYLLDSGKGPTRLVILADRSKIKEEWR